MSDALLLPLLAGLGCVIGLFVAARMFKRQNDGTTESLKRRTKKLNE